MQYRPRKMSVSLVQPLMLHQLLGFGPATYFSVVSQPLSDSNSHCGDALHTSLQRHHQFDSTLLKKKCHQSITQQDTSRRTWSVLANCAKFPICPAYSSLIEEDVALNIVMRISFLTVQKDLLGRNCCMCNFWSGCTGPWQGSAGRPAGKHNFWSNYSNFTLFEDLNKQRNSIQCHNIHFTSSSSFYLIQ